MIRRRLLVVEDDAAMRQVVEVTLRSHGYEVHAVTSGAEALKQVKAHPPDVVLLDLGLPDIDGSVVAASMRQDHDFPIIVLSARSEEQQRILALDSGADDYVTKPFREGELMARIRAALRRPLSEPERDELIVAGDLRLDTVRRRVFVQKAEVVLTPTELELLTVLARNADRVVTHRQLLATVWGTDHLEQIQYLRVYIKLLRQKLEREPARPRRIVTVLGVGYRLVTKTAN